MIFQCKTEPETEKKESVPVTQSRSWQDVATCVKLRPKTPQTNKKNKTGSISKKLNGSLSNATLCFTLRASQLLHNWWYQDLRWGEAKSNLCGRSGDEPGLVMV